jgi:hypothetical protein
MNPARNSQAPVAQPVGYILSPRIDFWMTGGASVVVMCLLLAYVAFRGVGDSPDKAALLGNMILFQAIINWPHFMGAYSLLYRPAENIKKYKFAAIYVPMALIAVVVFSALIGDQSSRARISVNQDVAYLFWLVAAFYLAWHYTGQAWGMIATFSRLSNLELSVNERLVVRMGLRSLLVWHVVWGAQDLPAHWLSGLHAHIPTLLTVMNVVCCTAFALGLAVWWRAGKRIGMAPDSRILASWLSVYMWYLVLYFMPEAFPAVQLSHALQYLSFPLRVELNRAGTAARARSLFWSARYFVFLIVAGVIVFYLPETVSDLSQKYTFAVMIASAVSIHHYFVDGCIWRIGNPDVRKSLFAHLSMTRPART